MPFRPPQPTTEESVKCSSTAKDFEKTHEWDLERRKVLEYIRTRKSKTRMLIFYKRYR